ncbi:hypothetical protein CMW49_09135 [Leuconostoc citreum]|nr:hypothetical protein CMW49_09135 [Leuconostoc citreum]
MPKKNWGLFKMNNLISQLFQDNNFNLVNEDLSLYTNKKNTEYYITKFYTDHELKNFFDCDKTGQTIEQFNKLSNSSDFHNIRKNTSLILLVEVENLSACFDNLRNNVILVEEDGYYFRKLVVLYSKNSVLNLTYPLNNKTLNEHLDKDFEIFEQNMFFSEQYLVEMQLAIKLPFFILENSSNVYQTIENAYPESNEISIDRSIVELLNRDEDFFEALEKISSDGDETFMQLSKIISEVNENEN